MCELFNGDVPFRDLCDPTLIMLEKLRGKQPLLMDKSTLDNNPIYFEDEKYLPYLKRKIPKTWHLFVSTLTTRPPLKRPTARMVLKVGTIFFLTRNFLTRNFLTRNFLTRNCLTRNFLTRKFPTNQKKF